VRSAHTRRDGKPKTFATADVASAIDAFARRIEELKRVPDLHQPNTG